MIFDSLLDVFRGKAVTIPPMDGALRPNTLLDDATSAVALEEPDALALSGGRLLASTGHRLVAISHDGEISTVESFTAPISALASGPDGAVAIALATGEILIRNTASGDRALAPADGQTCPTALAFVGADDLLVCHGSRNVGPGDWQVDLMRKGSTGSLWRIALASGERRLLAGGIAFPSGVLVDAAGARAIVSESWRHRLIAIPLEGGSPRPVLTTLPGYPSRLSPTADGGALLSIFAPRSRLIEFVLTEDAYRADMLAEVPRENWIAPALNSGEAFLEPLQCGSVRTMGVHKAWSPTRSYGLVVKLDKDLRPVASAHSRANGRRHGVTAAIEAPGGVLIASRGGGAVLALDPVLLAGA